MKIKKKTFYKIKRWFLIVITTLVVYGVFYSLFFTNFICIYSFQLDGVGKYQEQITNDLSNDLSLKFLWIFPQNNLITYRASVFKKSVTSVLTNTKSISVYPTGLHTIKIKVIPYTPAFNLENGDVLSVEGTEYKELNDTSNLPVLVATSTTMASSTFISSTISLLNKIDPVLFNINKVFEDEYGDIHLINTDIEGEIKFKSDSDKDKLWNTLISAIDTDPLKADLNDTAQKVVYIDLRYGNKVFYKFTKNDSKDIIATTTNNYEATSTGVLAEPNRQ